MYSIIENITDPNTHDVIAVEFPICGYCKNPVRTSRGHPQCGRVERELEATAAATWKQEQELKRQQERLQWEQSRPKTEAELRSERLEAEGIKAREEATWKYRKERLADIETEAANLRRLLQDHDDKS